MPEPITAETTIPAIEQMVMAFDQSTLPRDTAIFLIGVGLGGKLAIGFVVGDGTEAPAIKQLSGIFHEAAKKITPPC